MGNKILSIISLAAFFSFIASANARDYPEHACMMGESFQQAYLEQHLDGLKSKLKGAIGAEKWKPIQHGIPYHDLYFFSKGFGESWYKFGLNSSSGFQALFRADAMEADLLANATAHETTSVTLFNQNIPVLSAQLVAGNHTDLMDLLDAGKGVIKNPSESKEPWKKWLPKVNANLKLFGVTVYSKSLPSSETDTASLSKLNDKMKQTKKDIKKDVKTANDEFKKQRQAAAVQVGNGDQQGTSSDEVTASTPSNETKLSKDFRNFRRSAKDFGVPLVFPIFPPLNGEIDFGVFFSASLIFNFNLSGGGLSINYSKDLAQSSTEKLTDRLKSKLQSNKIMGAITSIASVNFMSGDFSLLAIADCGIAELIAMLESMINTLRTGNVDALIDKVIDSEFKGSVGVMPAISAGAFASVAAVLDLGVASASAGITGTLNLITAHIGGALEFSTFSDYVNLVSNGFLNLMSGTLTLFAKLEVNAVVYKETLEWSKVIFDFPGITKFYSVPIARMAFRGPDNAQVQLRPFMCMDLSLKRVTHYAYNGSTVNECDTNVISVPSRNSNELSDDIGKLVEIAGVKVPKVNDSCMTVINKSGIISTSADESCLNNLNPDNLYRTVSRAETMFKDKFVSNLFDQTGKPAVLLENYLNDSNQGESVLYSGYQVKKYDYDWNEYFNNAEDLASRSPASTVSANTDTIQDSNSNNYVPKAEPTINVSTSGQYDDLQNPIPAGKIGWLNDDDLLNAASKNLIGYCSIETGPIKGDLNDPNQNCAYYVKAMGIPVPDGASCIDRNGNITNYKEGSVISTPPSEYDCATAAGNANIDPKKVAACMLRSVFRDFCYPPQKTNYIVKLKDFVSKLSNNQIFALLTGTSFTQMMQTGNYQAPASSGSCKMSLNRDQYDVFKIKIKQYYKIKDYDYKTPNSDQINGICGTVIPSNSNYDSYVHYPNNNEVICTYYSNHQSFTCNTNSQIYCAKDSVAYLGTCSASILNSAGNKPSGIAAYYQCTDKSGKNTATGNNTTCDCSGALDSMATDFKKSLNYGSCEIKFDFNQTVLTNAPNQLYQKPPNTCELIAQYPPVTGVVRVLSNSLGNSIFANQGECKNALSGSETDLCLNAKSQIFQGRNPPNDATFTVSSRFQGSLFDEITTCKVGNTAPTLALTAGPKSGAALSSEGCDILLGRGISNTLIAKQYPNVSGDGVNCADFLPKENIANFCNNLSPEIQQAIRAKITSNTSELAAINIYTRLNTTDASGKVTNGVMTPIGTCNLAAPTAQLTMDVNGNKLGSCDLMARTQFGTDVVVDRKSTTVKSTKDTCFASLEPIVTTCENFMTLPAVAKENISKSGSFVSGKPVNLVMRFTPPTGSAITQNATSACTPGMNINRGTTCDLLVSKDGDNSKYVMDGTTQNNFLTRKLTSVADATSNDCANRFLAGAKLPTATSKPNESPTCLSLSAQIATSAGVKALANSTVSISSRFKKPGTADSIVSLGKCQYDADGKPVVNMVTFANTAQPTFTDMNKLGANASSNSTSTPYVTDIVYNINNPDLIRVLIKFNIPPVAPYFNRFGFNFNVAAVASNARVSTVAVPQAVAPLPRQPYAPITTAPFVPYTPPISDPGIDGGFPAPAPTSTPTKEAVAQTNGANIGADNEIAPYCTGKIGIDYNCRLPEANEIMTIYVPVKSLGACSSNMNITVKLPVIYPSTVPTPYKTPLESIFSKKLTGIKCQ